MATTTGEVFDLTRVVAVLEARSRRPIDLARESGVTEKQVSRILNLRVQRPHGPTLAALSRAIGLPDQMLEQVGTGEVTADQAIRYGRSSDLEDRVEQLAGEVAELREHLGEVAEVRQLLTDVLARLDGHGG
jgi:uncharacterized protein YceH (UPF0502 family)